MTANLSKLKASAGTLSEAERAELALSLIDSLDSLTDDPDKVKEAWAEEIQRRIAQIDAGEVDLVPGDEALARVRSRLR